MAIRADYQRLGTQEFHETKESKEQEERKIRNRQSARRITETGERKIADAAAGGPSDREPPAYVRGLHGRLSETERKLAHYEAKEKQREESRDGLAECAGRCVSVALRAVATPFILAGNGIARAFGCKT